MKKRAMIVLCLLIVMIGFTPHDSEGTIDLLDQKKAHHLMGKSHLGKRDLALRGIIDPGRKTIGASDEEDQTLGDALHLLLKILTELARGELLAFLVEQHQHVARQHTLEQHVGLPFLLLFLGEVSGILQVGNLLDGERHIMREATLVISNRLLKQLSGSLTGEKNVYSQLSIIKL